MLHHVGIEVADLGRSGGFYDAVFFPLGVRRLFATEHLIGWGTTEPRFFVTARSAPAPAFGHLAFAGAGRAAVDAAHAAGLHAGGTDAGTPGPRPHYGPTYYAGYLLDPDGIKVELVTKPGS